MYNSYSPFISMRFWMRFVDFRYYNEQRHVNKTRYATRGLGCTENDIWQIGQLENYEENEPERRNKVQIKVLSWRHDFLYFELTTCPRRLRQHVWTTKAFFRRALHTLIDILKHLDELFAPDCFSMNTAFIKSNWRLCQPNTGLHKKSSWP